MQLSKALFDSVASPKISLTNLLSRLQLKGTSFNVFTPASQEEMDRCWALLKKIEPDITPSVTKATLRDYPLIQQFIDHCCRKRHYLFEVRKCVSSDCTICKPPRLPVEVFETFHSLPDPTPGDDNHYTPFHDIFGQQTSEEHRPSLTLKQSRKTFPFSASLQHLMSVVGGFWREVWTQFFLNYYVNCCHA